MFSNSLLCFLRFSSLLLLLANESNGVRFGGKCQDFHTIFSKIRLDYSLSRPHGVFSAKRNNSERSLILSELGCSENTKDPWFQPWATNMLFIGRSFLLDGDKKKTKIILLQSQIKIRNFHKSRKETIVNWVKNKIWFKGKNRHCFIFVLCIR